MDYYTWVNWLVYYLVIVLVWLSNVVFVNIVCVYALLVNEIGGLFLYDEISYYFVSISIILLLVVVVVEVVCTYRYIVMIFFIEGYLLSTLL